MRPREEGFALLLVLFLVALLAAIVSQSSFTNQVAVAAGANRLSALQHAHALRAGLIEAGRLLRYDQTLDGQKTAPYDGLDEPWAQPATLPVGGATVRVAIVDQSARLQLNGIVDDLGVVQDDPERDDPLDRVRRLLTVLPDWPTSDDDLLEALVDWLDRAPPGAYEVGRFEKNAKNGPLYTLKELLLVPGFTRDVLYGWTPDGADAVMGLAPFVTARWGDGLVNPNTAPPEVLRALSPNMTEARAQTILTRREQAPFTNVQEVLSLFPDWPTAQEELGGLLRIRSLFFMVDLTSTIGQGEAGRGSTRHAVAHVQRGADGISVLHFDPD